MSCGRCTLEVFFMEPQTLKEDSALRNIRNVCPSTHTHSLTHTSMHTPYIIFVHNLICLSPPVYFAMVTAPTPLLDVSRTASSRHTFLWFLGWRRCSHFALLLMDVLISAALCESQWAALSREASGNGEKCREVHTLNGECGLITSLGRKVLDRLQCTKSWLSANQCYFMRFGAYYLLVFFFF